MNASTSSLQTRYSPDQIRRKVQELGEWFHNFHFDGIQTAPNHFLGDYPAAKWQRFAHAVPADMGGRSVLDIGCNAGFYSIEMKRRGAARVLGIDSQEHYLAQARFAAEIFEADVEFRNLSVYDVAGLGETFDIVLFMGVFYHLRHPLFVLDLLHEHAVKDLLIFQTMLRGSQATEPLADDYPFEETGVFDREDFPRMFFIEGKYAGDPTNWWIPNRAGVEAMLRSSGFTILDHPEPEVYICRKITNTLREGLHPPFDKLRANGG